MKKIRLKKTAILAIYGLTFISVFSSIYFTQKNLQPSNTLNDENIEKYVNKTIFEKDLPVTKEVDNEIRIMRPYTANDIVILKDYYDSKADPEIQKKSLIYFEDTYLQSSGIAYGGINNFDVVAILDGTVISIKEDNFLGKIVEIRHDNGMISSYQSLSNINVKENDVVKQGDVIGTSGENNISKELGNHLYFELIINGINVNPENYFGKTVKEI